LGNDVLNCPVEQESLTDYLRRLLVSPIPKNTVTNVSNRLRTSSIGNTFASVEYRRRRAEKELANANVVGIDSESALSANEDYVQRREGIIAMLQDVHD
jgi:hypothetical protein